MSANSCFHEEGLGALMLPNNFLHLSFRISFILIHEVIVNDSVEVPGNGRSARTESVDPEIQRDNTIVFQTLNGAVNPEAGIGPNVSGSGSEFRKDPT